MIVIFTLANGRSGTRFLSGLMRHNVRNCVSKHEPYTAWSNPTMFGRPIDDYLGGNTSAIRRLVQQKHRGILRYNTPVYIETNHAFLKSFADAAIEFFPDMKLIHLIRNPLKTARSETNRELQLHKWHVPFRWYTGGDGRRYFRWSLTHKEPIYQSFDLVELTLFQKYVIQWIEIENRAMQFLDRHHKHDDCFTLHSPGDINDPQRITQMFGFFGLQQAQEQIEITGHQNRTPGAKTIITEEERRQFRQVIEQLPAESLAVFDDEPYIGYDWIDLLRR